MVWTKATFWLVADTLRAEIDRGQYMDDEQNRQQNRRTVNVIAIKFADTFAKSNPRFDRAKFIKACGLED